jgi:predicted dehydrogenase
LGSEFEVKIAIIGCGYVFDHYMTTWKRHPKLELVGVTDRDRGRAETAGRYYGLRTYDGNEEVFADPAVDIVVNLTSVESHYEVTKAALEAGKHVYSEKPLTMQLDRARELFALAESRGLQLSCAPSNALSDTTQTMWKAVREGAVGDVRIVYAEFDDNPIYLMGPEHWRSRSGAPWPYLHEYEMGCTWEHVGYHLSWLCAMFGPVETATAFSRNTIHDKTDVPLNPPDTPDFSVAALNFESGVVARVTCSIGAPYDHRMRIIGNKGMIWADTYRNYRCPVYLERFTKLSMNARKAISVRNNTLLQRLFGVGGERLELLELAPPGAEQERRAGARWWKPTDLMTRVRRYQLGQQDKAIGVAELTDAIETGRPPFPSHDFSLHLTELTLAIQAAGTKTETYRPTSRFKTVDPQPGVLLANRNYRSGLRLRLMARALDGVLDRAHRHGGTSTSAHSAR